MIGKIVTGKSFRGAVEYVLGKPQARLLESDGVDTENARTVTDSFNYQRKARHEIAKVVGHVSLSFHKDDAPKLSDKNMVILAKEYMQAMNIRDTQYIVVRHTDTEHPHLHIIYNRVKYDGKLVPDSNERRRNPAVCKSLKRKYGLTFSEGKHHVKTERLHGSDRTRQEIYDAVRDALTRCTSGGQFRQELRRHGILFSLVHRGNNPDNEVQGATFTKGGITFKASQIDRQFSFLKIVKRITENAEKERQQMITHIRGHALTPDEQRRLYSPAGLTGSYIERGWRYHSTFRVHKAPDRHILTEEHLSSERISRNPTLFGVELSDEQVKQIKDGQFIYMENLRDKDGKPFDGYLVADDRLQHGWMCRHRPDAWVRYGKYEMREMDKLLIEHGYVTRAVVKWYDNYQTARPYLWKEKPTDETYRESWDDPRKPRQKQERELHAPFIYPTRNKGRKL